MLRLTNIRKSYGQRLAVDGLSLDIRPGEMFGLLGPNGAGKSTTIAIAVGLLRPDAGEARLMLADGDAGCPTDPAVRARLGVAPQSLAIYDDLSAEENLRLFARLHGLSPAAQRERVNEVLRLIGLEDRRRSRATTFSGGMKRRLNLGLALIHDPPMLLLDEPTVGVDPQSRNAIFDLLINLKTQGRTILYTTHYMEEAQRLCDRVGIIDHGRLLALGTVNELIDRHLPAGGRSLITIERGGRGGREEIATDDPVGVLAAVLAGDGAAPDGIRVDRANLESVFLRLTGRSLRD